MAVMNTQPEYSDLAAGMQKLGALLFARFEITENTGDLERAIQVTEFARAITLPDDPKQTQYLLTLAECLGQRFRLLGEANDIDAAVEMSLEALDIATTRHPPPEPRDRIVYLSQAGNWLCKRFETTGELADVNCSIELAEMAVAMMPAEDKRRPAMLTNVGYKLGIRFESTGAIEDLNRAIQKCEDAVESSTGTSEHLRPFSLNHLARWLDRRFERTGQLDDLNRAVEVASTAVQATPPDNPLRAEYLFSFGNYLCRRFGRLGELDDLNRAVELAEEALTIVPPDRHDRARALDQLGTCLGLRFERTTARSDLDRAIRESEMAVQVTAHTPGHPFRARCLHNLGAWLSRRYELMDTQADLIRGVEVAEMALDATPPNHSFRAKRLSNLGMWIRERARRTGNPDSLNRSIRLIQSALSIVSLDHTERILYLGNLARSFLQRHEHTSAREDIDGAISSFKEAWSCRTASPSIRISLAFEAATLLASLQNWKEASFMLDEAVHLLPKVSPRSLKQTDKQSRLVNHAGIASMAAATALNAGESASRALQLLELGRGVIAGSLMEMRGTISHLEKKHPDWAKTFASLRDELDSPVDMSLASEDKATSSESQAKRRREADEKLNQLIETIRAEPDFHRFLLPPDTNQLMAAANPHHVIVVNLSSYRSDAFLIEGHQIRTLPLPRLVLEDVQVRAQNIKDTQVEADSLLEWLWDVIARPCLDELGFDGPPSSKDYPRVWWVPTGYITKFPLHAAGRHGQGSFETVLDRVMSSYSTSVRALAHLREQSLTQLASPRALLVAMQDTPGAYRLPFAADEVNMLRGLCKSMGIEPVEPTRRNKDVVTHLPGCEIFHFAGHGYTDPRDPSKSFLLLEDGKDKPLTVASLLDMNFRDHPPFLAYLSACGTGRTEDGRLVDESIHLIGAFQLAGFRHVIGTLWEVIDDICVEMAKFTYDGMKEGRMTDDSVCRGLHIATTMLRDRWLDISATVRREDSPARSGDHPAGMEAPRRVAVPRDMDPPDDDGVQVRGPALWIPYVHFGA
ncbi:hypothetical protein FOPE_10120 [Fonsecaea pedrosoi]|nr:hypothetical protein FOPE_10120 [Fonsecaea pedrosoi]